MFLLRKNMNGIIQLWKINSTIPNCQEICEQSLNSGMKVSATNNHLLIGSYNACLYYKSGQTPVVQEAKGPRGKQIILALLN